MDKIKVAVLFGGASSEHEVSEMSAASVLQNINRDKYDVYPIGITKDGKWYYYKGDINNIKGCEWEKHKDNLPACFTPGSGEKGLITSKGSINVDVVFPVLHGKYGEDGTVQGLLEMVGVPYVGCKVLSSAVCMDKIVANNIMDAHRIGRCEWDYMTASEIKDFDAIEVRLAEKLHYPIFVKPANAGSSVGITKAEDKHELLAAVRLALQHDKRVVFERFVDGHEIECAVMGADKPFATMPGEIIASKEFYDYEDKYLAGTSHVEIPAKLPVNTLDKIHRTAIESYKALCCEGLARVDFFVERKTGRVLLNEINTMPGFTAISMYPKLMMASGLTYSDIIDKLITQALAKQEGYNG
ncbi:MAG: D-alanine--D-alanine ligase family protein [Oscillospiraceae bacterium]